MLKSAGRLDKLLIRLRIDRGDTRRTLEPLAPRPWCFLSESVSNLRRTKIDAYAPPFFRFGNS